MSFFGGPLPPSALAQISFLGLAGAAGAYGYSMPSLQGETTVNKVDKPPTQGINPTMPFQFVTKLYADKNITFVHSAAPTDTPAEGTLRTSSISGVYKVTVYLNGGWREVALT